MPNEYFDEADIELMAQALALVPEFETAVYTTKLCRGIVSFPVNSIEELEPVLIKLGGHITFKGVSFDFARIRSFLPKFCFPIEDEADLLRKSIIGFTAASVKHNEARRALMRKRHRKMGVAVHFPPGYSFEGILGSVSL